MDWMKKMNLNKCHQKKEKMLEDLEESRLFMKRMNRTGEITTP